MLSNISIYLLQKSMHTIIKKASSHLFQLHEVDNHRNQRECLSPYLLNGVLPIIENQLYYCQTFFLYIHFHLDFPVINEWTSIPRWSELLSWGISYITWKEMFDQERTLACTRSNNDRWPFGEKWVASRSYLLLFSNQMRWYDTSLARHAPHMGGVARETRYKTRIP